MYIVSKETGVILNLDNVVELYVANDRTALLARAMGEKIIMVQEYESPREAKEALMIISEEIGRKDVVHVPNKDTIKGRIVNSRVMQEQHHNIGGKKTKGHGGS